jgi:cathepsin X
VRTPQPHTYLSPAELPASYDIRNLLGVNYAALTRNQHIPQCALGACGTCFVALRTIDHALCCVDCGSCWAQSTASALSDRIALTRGNAFPEVVLSPQVLVDCVTDSSHGCQGGDPTAAYAYVMQHGLTDESCAPYLAANGECSAQAICSDCSPNPMTGCYAVTPGALFHVTEHGQANGEDQMLAEIATRGSITCGICVSEAFEAYEGGVFHDESNCKAEMHAIVISGYGTSPDGRKTWLGRNSWGQYWGENGWFELERGVDALGIESIGCDWGVVQVPHMLLPA